MDSRYAYMHAHSMTAAKLRAHIIAMVADGDLRLAEMTREGPRFQYTPQGRRRWRRNDNRRVKMALQICALVTWCIASFLVLARFGS